jgi:hypothetical protein
MELYGSLHNISGSITASVFTGSFIGDGSGLTGIQAAGVVGLNLSQIATGSFSASLSPNGFNVNTDTSITGAVNITGSISLNGEPIGTGKLNETTFQSYTSSNDGRVTALETSSGSLNSFTSSIDTTIKSKLNSDGVISGSLQILNDSNLVSSSTQVTAYGFATTGSNLFKGTQTHSGSILPSVDNEYDLGSPTYQWRDVYISSGSLYIDGTKVISSTSQELTITTDTGQSIKILESTTDSIILQVADGDIELKSSGDGDILLDPTNGKIMLKGPIEILNGQKIQSSVGGTPVVFANDIVVSGSIDITGTIEGINLTDFSSSVNTRVSNLESGAGSLNSFTASANNRLNSLESTSGSLNTFTSSATSRLSSIETTTGSLNSYTSSNNTRLSSIETTTSSILGVNTTQNSRLDSLETTSGSILTTNTAQSGRLDSIEGKSGSYATTGSNIFQGDQTITGSLYISQNLIIAGSSSIQNISSSVLNIADNIITVNAINPSVRFGGLAVIDSGSSPQVSGSMLFDSVNNQWLFVHQNQGTVTSSVLLMGPETYNNVGNETYITSNRLVKSTGIEHLTNSNISDDGTTVTILSNAVVNGTFSATGTTLVSGSSQISHDSTTGYVANRHIDHSGVSISAGNGLSGGGDITTTRTITLDTASATFTSGVKSKMSADGVVSGSSQVSFNGITDKPTLVSGSSQITYGSLSSIPAGIVSGSSQITFGSISSIPGGLVSGSSQIDLTSTTNYSTGIKTRLNAEGVLSGSAQVTLTSGQVTTGLGFTPYNSTNPAGYTTNTGTVTSVGGTGTVSGLSLSGTVTGTGNLTLGGTLTLTSGNVTTALGFTPYNATNPAGYITGVTNISGTAGSAPTLTSSGTLTTQAGSGTLTYSSPIVSSEAGLFSTGDNSNGIITFNRHPGAYYSQLGFNSSGGVFYRSFNNTSINTTQAWQTVWTSSSLTNLNQLTNGPGYITGVTNISGTAASETLSTVTGRGNSTAQNIVFSNGRKGLVGVYDAAQTQAIFAMGPAYVLTDGGGSATYGDIYGLAWSYNPGYGGAGNNPQSKPGLNHQLLHMQAGVTTTAIGTGIWTSGGITCGTILPLSNNAHNLGSTGTRWANIYTNDLHLSNEGKEGGNEIDGTTGNWTIQEGEENLYIINHKNGKKFKIDLTEIV